MPAKWIKLDLGCELLFSVAYFQQKDHFLYTLCGMCSASELNNYQQFQEDLL